MKSEHKYECWISETSFSIYILAVCGLLWHVIGEFYKNTSSHLNFNSDQMIVTTYGVNIFPTMFKTKTVEESETYILCSVHF